MTDDSEKIVKLFGDIESIKLQLARLVSDAESEKDTRARTTDFVIDQVRKVEKDLREILYGDDGRGGMVVQLDRLQQELNERKSHKKNIIAIWISIGAIILKEIFDWIKNK